MRTPDRWGRPFVGFFAVLIPSLALAQPPEARVAATPDRKSLLLSESMRATLEIEGPAPLRVELPSPLLAPEAERDWKVRPTGPATVTPLSGGGERWVQVLRLDPYVAGESQYIRFAPLKVNGRETPGPGFEVAVSTNVTDAKPGEARPVTGIEEVPPVAPPPPASSIWVWSLVGLFAVVAAALAWRSRRRPKPVPPHVWAAAEFDRLARDGVGGEPLVDGVAAVVRGFIERLFGIPAPTMTTEELLATAEHAGWPVAQTDPLRRLLEVFDRSKFAGDIPDDDGCRNVLAGGREWVGLVPFDPEPR